jgi:hypothetical protein
MSKKETTIYKNYIPLFNVINMASLINTEMKVPTIELIEYERKVDRTKSELYIDKLNQNQLSFIFKRKCDEGNYGRPKHHCEWSKNNQVSNNKELQNIHGSKETLIYHELPKNEKIKCSEYLGLLYKSFDINNAAYAFLNSINIEGLISNLNNPYIYYNVLTNRHYLNLYSRLSYEILSPREKDIQADVISNDYSQLLENILAKYEKEIINNKDNPLELERLEQKKKDITQAILAKYD